MKLTPEAFDALAALLRLRDSPRREAARLALVEGARPADAARRSGINPQNVNDAMRACERGARLAETVAAGLTLDTAVYLYPVAAGKWAVVAWRGEKDLARWPQKRKGGALPAAIRAAAEMSEKFGAANRQRWADFASEVFSGAAGYGQSLEKNLPVWASDPEDVS
jgi:hypothetical protein